MHPSRSTSRRLCLQRQQHCCVAGLIITYMHSFPLLLLLVVLCLLLLHPQPSATATFRCSWVSVVYTERRF
jgi:hypothetical protein